MRPGFPRLAALLVIPAALAFGAGAADGLAPEHKAEVAEALKKEQADAYKQIEWQANFEAARKKANERNRPILVVLVVGHLGQKGAAECWLGGRILRGSSLSDPKIIQKINEAFVAVELNLTDQGFPKDAPALDLWQKAFGTKTSYKSAFATTIVMGPNGKWPFGSSGSGYLADFESAINYHPEKFAKYLEESLARWKKAVAIASDESLDEAARKARLDALYADILASIKSANEPAGRK